MTTGGRTNTEQFCVCFFSLSFYFFKSLPAWVSGWRSPKAQTSLNAAVQVPLVKSHAAGCAALLAWQSDLGLLKLTSYVNRQYQFCGTAQQKGSSWLGFLTAVLEEFFHIVSIPGPATSIRLFATPPCVCICSVWLISSPIWQSSPKCWCRRTGVTELQSAAEEVKAEFWVFSMSHIVLVLRTKNGKKLCLAGRTLITLSPPYSV